MKKRFLCIILCSIVQFSYSQNHFPSSGSVGIGTTSPHASAALDIHSTSKGLLFPRLTAAQRASIASPAQGLVVFQTNGAKGFYYYDGGWRNILNDAANRSLSNLSATALNRDLLPNKTNERNIGSTSLGFKNLYLEGHFFIGGEKIITRSPSISNFFIGPFAGNTSASGLNNTASGHRALQNLSSGFANTAIGDLSLLSNTTGSNNTAVGHTALASNTTGLENSALGMQSLVQNTTGFVNTAIGAFSLYSNKSGNGNTGMGSGALMSSIMGHYNTAVGRHAILDLQSGNENVAVGNETALNAIQLSWCTFVGSGILTLDNLYNATGIGYGTYVTASNQVRIGNIRVKSIGGFRDWTNMSDGRFKNVVPQEVPGLSFINQLRPVVYSLNNTEIENALNNKIGRSDIESSGNQPNDNTLYTGFIAQEVEAAAKKINYEFSGIDKPNSGQDLYGLRYATFVVPLVKAVQELHATVVTLQDEMTQLKKEIEAIRMQSVNNQYNSDITGVYLRQIVPNPAQNMAVVQYELPARSSYAFLLLTNMKGQQIKQYTLPIGNRQLQLNTSALPAGTYSCSLWADGKLLDTKYITIIH